MLANDPPDTNRRSLRYASEQVEELVVKLTEAAAGRRLRAHGSQRMNQRCLPSAARGVEGAAGRAGNDRRVVEHDCAGASVTDQGLDPIKRADRHAA